MGRCVSVQVKKDSGKRPQYMLSSYGKLYSITNSKFSLPTGHITFKANRHQKSLLVITLAADDLKIITHLYDVIIYVMLSCVLAYMYNVHDGQQARNSVVQGCTFFLRGHTHCYIECIAYTLYIVHECIHCVYTTYRSPARIVEAYIDPFEALTETGELTVIIQNIGTITASYQACCTT